MSTLKRFQSLWPYNESNWMTVLFPLQVLGFCVPDRPFDGGADTAVAMVTELGEPIDQIKLLQMSWEDRLKVSNGTLVDWSNSVLFFPHSLRKRFCCNNRCLYLFVLFLLSLFSLLKDIANEDENVIVTDNSYFALLLAQTGCTFFFPVLFSSFLKKNIFFFFLFLLNS